MYSIIHFIMVFLGTISGFTLAESYMKTPFFIELFPENTMLMTSLFFGSLGYLIGFAIAYFLNKVIKKYIQKTNLNKVIPQLLGVAAGLVLVNLLLIPIYIFMFNLENTVFLKYIKLMVPLFFNIVFIFFGGNFGEKYFSENFENIKGFVVDTNLIIDGRIEKFINLPLFNVQMIIPDFILEEIQILADNNNEVKRKKGKRALESLENLKKLKKIIVEKSDDNISDTIDNRLIYFCKKNGHVLFSADYSLIKKAKIEGVEVLFFKDIEDAFRPVINFGDNFNIKLVKKGKDNRQAVGYFEDGTMIVAQNGKDYIGEEVNVIVDNIVSTNSGKIIFVNVIDKSL